MANRFYLHYISLDGSRTKIVVSGLDFAVAVDFHNRLEQTKSTLSVRVYNLHSSTLLAFRHIDVTITGHIAGVKLQL